MAGADPAGGRTHTSTTIGSRPGDHAELDPRGSPRLGIVARPLHRLAMEQLTDMLVGLITDSPGFRRAQTARRISLGRWRSSCWGGLREA